MFLFSTPFLYYFVLQVIFVDLLNFFFFLFFLFFPSFPFFILKKSILSTLLPLLSLIHFFPYNFFFLSLVCLAVLGVVHSLDSISPGSFYRPNTEHCDWENLADIPMRDWPPECPLDFLTSFYFVLITISTVGLGDIGPSK